MSPVLADLAWPILERIPLFGDLAISPHGIGTAVGFLVGAVLMLRRVDRRGLGHSYVPEARERVQDMLFRAAIGAIVGARFFYVLAHLDDYAQDPLAVLRMWEGGFTFLGGLVGAVVAVIPMMRREGYRAAQVLDSAAPGIAVGVFIGRVGDLVIGDHIGDVASGWPLAWRCTGNYWDAQTNSFAFGNPVPPVPYGGGPLPTQGCFDVAVHQTALYDFVQAGLLLALLLWLERGPRWDGFFITVFVYWYGAARFVFDFLREDRRFLGLTGSQYAGLAAIVALTVYLLWRRPWQDRPWAWAPPDFDRPWLQPPAEEPASEPEPGDAAEAADRG